MGADYSFELISIETYVPQFIGHTKLFLGSVYYETDCEMLALLGRLGSWEFMNFLHELFFLNYNSVVSLFWEMCIVPKLVLIYIIYLYTIYWYRQSSTFLSLCNIKKTNIHQTFHWPSFLQNQVFLFLYKKNGLKKCWLLYVSSD